MSAGTKKEDRAKQRAVVQARSANKSREKWKPTSGHSGSDEWARPLRNYRTAATYPSAKTGRYELLSAAPADLLRNSGRCLYASLVFRNNFHHVDADVVFGMFTSAVPYFSVRNKPRQVYAEKGAGRHKARKAQLQTRSPDIEYASL